MLKKSKYNSRGGDYLFLITGLGNPGKQYHETRHNAGFLAIDQLANKLGVTLSQKGFQSLYAKTKLGNVPVYLLKPQTYMNLSGQAVLELALYYKIPAEQILVIYDDLDLELGVLRIRTNGSAGGHRGLSSIIGLMDTDQIARIRIGIGKPPIGVSVADYVLSRFNATEMEIIEQTVKDASEAAYAYVTKGIDYTMNHFNGKRS